MDTNQRTNNYSIRHATESDLGSVLDVEASAGQKWRSVPALAELAGDATLTVASLTSVRLQGGGVVLVACTKAASDDDHNGDEEKVIGVLVASQLDQSTFVHEMDVAEAYQGRGVGRALLQTLHHELDGAAISLTTFREVSWNAPWYSKIGFKIIETEDAVEKLLGKDHAARLRDEKMHFAKFEPAGYTRCMMIWNKEANTARVATY